MKNFDLASMGVHEMSTLEMKETDGGIIWVLVVAGLVLLGATSCNNNNVTVQIGEINSSTQKGGGTMSADSTLNGNVISPLLPGPKND